MTVEFELIDICIWYISWLFGAKLSFVFQQTFSLFNVHRGEYSITCTNVTGHPKCGKVQRRFSRLVYVWSTRSQLRGKIVKTESTYTSVGYFNSG